MLPKETAPYSALVRLRLQRRPQIDPVRRHRRASHSRSVQVLHRRDERVEPGDLRVDRAVRWERRWDLRVVHVVTCCHVRAHLLDIERGKVSDAHMVYMQVKTHRNEGAAVRRAVARDVDAVQTLARPGLVARGDTACDAVVGNEASVDVTTPKVLKDEILTAAHIVLSHRTELTFMGTAATVATRTATGKRAMVENFMSEIARERRKMSRGMV